VKGLAGTAAPRLLPGLWAVPARGVEAPKLPFCACCLAASGVVSSAPDRGI